MQHHAYHDGVLRTESVDDLIVRRGGIYGDGTTGTGDHSEEILRRLDAHGRLICVDQDPDVIEVARERLGDSGGRVRFFRGSFHRMDLVLAEFGIDRFDGILLDLGLNSWSLSRPSTGLSYQVDAPLDMAVDPDVPRNAREWLSEASEAEIATALRDFGGVRRAGLYARRIVAAARSDRLHTTGDLARAVAGGRPADLGPAELSRIFQAVRVVVLQEMERLEAFLEHAAEWIRPGGRLVIITYASHEDRRVKSFALGDGAGRVFTPLRKKPLLPSSAEVRMNRRARSAKLRSFSRGEHDEGTQSGERG